MSNSFNTPDANQQEGSSNNSQNPHVEHLNNQDAVDRIKSMAEKADLCFFITTIKTGEPLNVRPMSCAQVDDEGNLWFLSMKSSEKNKEIELDSKTQLLFQVGNYSGFLSLYGDSEILFNREKLDELWSPLAKTWFQGGKDDPEISLIKFRPLDGYYWDTKHGSAVAFLKMAASVISGKTMDDSIEGQIKV